MVRVGYYNVMYDISSCSEFDEMKFKYFTNRIQKGVKMFMRDIEQWCEAKNLHYHTSFVYRKDLPLKANIFNYYSYLMLILFYHSAAIAMKMQQSSNHYM